MLRLRSIKRQTAPAAWLLMVLLAFAPLGRHTAATVLCFGADGHIAAELAGGSSHVSSIMDAPARAPIALTVAVGSEAADESHFGGCVDIPLPNGGDTDCSSFRSESGPTAKTVLLVVALLPSPHHKQVAAPAPFRSQDGQHALPSDPTPLRSVVLLI